MTNNIDRAAECDQRGNSVAEVVRLHRGIGDRIRAWLRVAEKISARGDDETAWLVKVMALQLGDILEGDTDE